MNEDKSVAKLALDTLTRHRNIERMLYTHGEEVQRVVNLFPGDAVKGITVDDMSFNLSISGDKYTLVECMRVLRRIGYNTDWSKPEGMKSYWSAMYRKEEGEGPEIYLSFSSTECRRVKVGTKMQEVDIYEIVCGEAFPTGDSPTAACSHKDRLSDAL